MSVGMRERGSERGNLAIPVLKTSKKQNEKFAQLTRQVSLI